MSEEIAFAFNCPIAEAKLIALRKTKFHAAISDLGPIRAWKSKDGWTLGGKLQEPRPFIEAANRMKWKYDASKIAPISD
tara:strand:+ start:412 stop:648 length:237 start_codon:yes stop_codon:yes gene_type:complete